MTKQWLRANVQAPLIGVDREQRVLRGYVVAQAGIFKDRRGEFDKDGLKTIASLINTTPKGLKSRLGHPTASSDGVGKYLGRVRNARLDRVRSQRGGRSAEVDAVRAELYFDSSAKKTPDGDLADYVMSLAESDPDALSTSLVLQPEEVFRIDQKGKPLTDAEGRELPPLWIPKVLHASDVVDDGDAVDGILSAEGLAQALSVGLTPELAQVLRFDNVARLGTQLLDGLFKDQTRGVVESRCLAWLGRYLDLRYGEPVAGGAIADSPAETPTLDRYALRLQEIALEAARRKR